MTDGVSFERDDSNGIHLCSNWAKSPERLSDEINRLTKFIKTKTTPVEFEDFTRQITEYNIDMKNGVGFHACSVAMFYANYQLVEHITRVYGKHVLNLANLHGSTPALIHVANMMKYRENENLLCYEEAFSFLERMVEDFDLNLAFIRDCNIFSSSKCFMETIPCELSYNIPQKSTLLWLAVKFKDIRLIKFLLRNGAIRQENEMYTKFEYGRLTEKKRKETEERLKVLDLAESEIEEERRQGQEVFPWLFYREGCSISPTTVSIVLQGGRGFGFFPSIGTEQSF